MSAAENFVRSKQLEKYNMYQLYDGRVLSPFIPVVPPCGKMTADINQKICMFVKFVKYFESQFNNIDNDDDGWRYTPCPEKRLHFIFACNSAKC